MKIQMQNRKKQMQNRKKQMKNREKQMNLNKTEQTWIRREYEAVYTVETACVMAVFCLTMIILIQQAYRIHDETTSGMNLQEAVEAARHNEEERLKEIEEQFGNQPGLLFSMSQADVQLERKLGRIYGKFSGQRERGTWSLQISESIYKPEEFLRQVAALKQLEERNEGQLQEGNAP